jgi:hypothetical protein
VKYGCKPIKYSVSSYLKSSNWNASLASLTKTNTQSMPHLSVARLCGISLG